MNRGRLAKHGKHAGQSGHPHRPRTSAMQASQDLAQAHLHHIETALERLNERIARLARVLEISLESESVRLKILDGSLSIASEGQHADTAHARRRRHEWEELRGLMVLRMHLIKETLDDLGLEPTYQIALVVHERMTLEGFPPGSDGFEMLQRLAAEHDRRLTSEG